MGNCIARSSGAELFHAVTAGDKERALDRVHETPLLLFKQRGEFKRTVWHECAANGQLDVLRALVHHVRDTVPLDEQSAKPVTGRIHPAIRDAINSYDRDGYPALILACKAGHHEVATFLLDQVRPWHVLQRGAVYRSSEPQGSRVSKLLQGLQQVTCIA